MSDGRVKITKRIVDTAEVRDRKYNIRDAEVVGLALHIEPTGAKSWILDYSIGSGRKNRRRSTRTLATADKLTVSEARALATRTLAQILQGETPVWKQEKKEVLTLKTFIEKYYRAHTETEHKTENAIEMLERDFVDFLSTPLSEITPLKVRQWQQEEVKRNKASSANRKVNALQSALNWAVTNDLIQFNPLKGKIRKLKETDSREIIRYLTQDERARLMQALDERDKETHDHLKPLVIVALNTGIRRKALMNLIWSDIDFDKKDILLRASTAKSEKTYHIPMNALVCETLRQWQRNKGAIAGALVFPSPTGSGPMHDARSAWERLLIRAGIKAFRWHDMRHSFASDLIMQGVDILTVQKLMCHSSLSMTLRYAHLAPDVKSEAVERLTALYA